MKFNNGNNIYFFSDPHYNHINIVEDITHWGDKSGCRPFKNLFHMNETIIKNINDKVKEDDILFCLGDWSFGGIENVFEFRNRINCKTLHLILGNHDEKIRKNQNDVQSIFTSVTKDILSIQIEDKTLILNHYPIYDFNKIFHSSKNNEHFHLYGHVHKNTVDIDKTKSLNLSMEAINYIPLSFNEIKAKLK